MLLSDPHLKVAFTTNSLTWVDVDFARARHLVVYDVTAAASNFLDAQEFHLPAEEGHASRPGDQLSAKMAGLDGVGVLFTTGLSERSAIRLAQSATFPVVIEHRRAIDHVIARLQTLMHRDPPLWLCRMLRYGAPPPVPPLLDPAVHDRF